jgi:hypothetical protein
MPCTQYGPGTPSRHPCMHVSKCASKKKKKWEREQRSHRQLYLAINKTVSIPAKKGVEHQDPGLHVGSFCCSLFFFLTCRVFARRRPGSLTLVARGGWVLEGFRPMPTTETSPSGVRTQQKTGAMLIEATAPHYTTLHCFALHTTCHSIAIVWKPC